VLLVEPRPAIQSELQQAIARAAGGETVRYDVVVRMKNDSRMTIDFMLRPLLDEAASSAT
jgi:hypothetical protein